MKHFELTQRDAHCRARCGVLHTAHGRVRTPAFMPIGTLGAVKGITPSQIERTGAQMLLSNTYHLLLRPGTDVVERIGGLHKLMSWPRPIVTDSGGYQVFSLAGLTKIDDEGVQFASHIDGAPIYLNAEKATEIQNRLGADVIMCFDQCTPHPCDADLLKQAVARTIAWAGRCKAAHQNDKQMLFGIVQGGVDPDLRARCAAELVDMDFDGYAIGGLSVGEGHEAMIETTEHTAPLLPADKPRYLMGVGMPADIIAAVAAGVDMFDCVLPTRNGRNAYAFTNDGPLRLRNSQHITSAEPIEADCDCYCCEHFSRAAIRHFFNVGEMLGPILLSLHNLRFYQRLMAEIHSHINNGDFAQWAIEQIARYRSF